jgi:signal peptidase I
MSSSTILDSKPEVLVFRSPEVSALEMVPDPSRGPVPSLLNDRFEVLLWLGDSQRSSDFVGYDRLTQQSVVVRIFSQDLVKDLETKKILGNLFSQIYSLDHEALVPMVEWGSCRPTVGADPIHFVVTRPPDGPTLGRVIDQRGPIPHEHATAVRFAVDVLLDVLANEGLRPSKIGIDSIWLTPDRGLQVDPIDLILDIATGDKVTFPQRETFGLSHNLGSENSIGSHGSFADSTPKVLPHTSETTSSTTTARVAKPAMAKSSGRNKHRKLVRRLATTILSALLLVVSWLTMAPPKWGGQLTFTVVSGTSMEPGFHTGDLVVLRRASRYRKGDVVTYSVPEKPYTSYNVVHRIVKELPDGRFIIRGDNRDADDPWLVSNSDIRGKQVLLVAKGGFVLLFFSTPIGFALMFGVLVTAWLWGSPMLRGHD